MDLHCLGQEVLRDRWVWDSDSKSSDVELSSDCRSAFFHSDPVNRTTCAAGARGERGFRDGRHYWEVVLLEPAAVSSVMVGVGTARTSLNLTDNKNVNLIGQDGASWGLSHKGLLWHEGKSRQYCQAFYERNTVIGCDLNLYTGTLRFYKDGMDMGVAFSGLNKVGAPLYPIISSSAAETELGLGMQTCSYLSLQDKCCAVVKNSLLRLEHLDSLPLPNLIRNHIRVGS